MKGTKVDISRAVQCFQLDPEVKMDADDVFICVCWLGLFEVIPFNAREQHTTQQPYPTTTHDSHDNHRCVPTHAVTTHDNHTLLRCKQSITALANDIVPSNIRR